VVRLTASPDISSRPGVTATADVGVPPGVLGSRTLRRTVKYASGPVPRTRGITRWHTHLQGLEKPIHETSGHLEGLASFALS
jgi:hypothetical protein